MTCSLPRKGQGQCLPSPSTVSAVRVAGATGKLLRFPSALASCSWDDDLRACWLWASNEKIKGPDTSPWTRPREGSIPRVSSTFDFSQPAQAAVPNNSRCTLHSCFRPTDFFIPPISPQRLSPHLSACMLEAFKRLYRSSLRSCSSTCSLDLPPKITITITITSCTSCTLTSRLPSQILEKDLFSPCQSIINFPLLYPSRAGAPERQFPCAISITDYTNSSHVNLGHTVPSTSPALRSSFVQDFVKAEKLREPTQKFLNHHLTCDWRLMRCDETSHYYYSEAPSHRT